MPPAQPSFIDFSSRFCMLHDDFALSITGSCSNHRDHRIFFSLKVCLNTLHAIFHSSVFLRIHRMHRMLSVPFTMALCAPLLFQTRRTVSSDGGLMAFLRCTGRICTELSFSPKYFHNCPTAHTHTHTAGTRGVTRVVSEPRD